MKTNSKQQNFHLIVIALLMIVIVTSIIAFSPQIRVTAQAQTNVWTEPVNLSQTGGTGTPRMAIDSDENIHVIWSDIFDGILSTSQREGQWSTPEAGMVPFENFTPQLISDNAGNIHAYWINERMNLLHSRISSSNFGLSNSWSGAVAISDFVVGFESTVDHLGNIHLAYIRNIDINGNPPGLYYTKSTNEGANWAASTLLYQSDYLRSIDPDAAHLQLASSPKSEDEADIFIVWDNSPLRRVYLIKSVDIGQTWEPYIEVDGPSNTMGLSTPFNINISANREDIVLVWQVGQKGVSCSLHSKSSNDSGENWTESQRILKQLSSGGCPQENWLIGNTDTFSILMTKTQGQAFLSAWNGSNWSDPQLQSTMGSFVDPVTLANVDLGCQNAIISNDQLFDVGCDEGVGKDIWFISRPLGNLQDWFPPPSIWTNPSIISTSSIEFQSLQAVADLNGGVHSFWMQPSGIYYSRWDGTSWIQASEIIRFQINEYDKLSATIGQDDILYLTWSGGDSGELFFSWANSSAATHKNDWSAPQSIPSPQLANNSPDIYINNLGTIFIIYNIAVNENRGVYLVRSDDRGESWSDPEVIFDAVDSGWETVDQTRVSRGSEGAIFATWVQSSLRKGPLGLYFTKIDNFMDNSKASLVVSNPVIWNDLLSDASGNLHRVWQEPDDNQSTLWHSYSTDQGETWAQPFTISNIGDIPGASSVTADKYGQLHLTYLAKKEDTSLNYLKYWVWNGDIWSSAEGLGLGEFGDLETASIASTISSNNEVFSLFSQSDPKALEEEAKYILFYSKKQIASSATEIELPSSVEATETPQRPPQTQTPTPEPEINISITSTPTQATTLQISQPPSDNSMSSLVGAAVGIGLVILLVAIAFVFRLFQNSRNR